MGHGDTVSLCPTRAARRQVLLREPKMGGAGWIRHTSNRKEGLSATLRHCVISPSNEKAVLSRLTSDAEVNYGVLSHRCK